MEILEIVPDGLMGVGNPSGPGKDGGHQNVNESSPLAPKSITMHVENWKCLKKNFDIL